MICLDDVKDPLIRQKLLKKQPDVSELMQGLVALKTETSELHDDTKALESSISEIK